MHHTYKDEIAVRTNANNEVVEWFSRKTTTWEYGILLTPEGPQNRTLGRKARFFVSNEHGKRTELRFLEEKGDNYGDWSMVRPVADTGCWVKVERLLEIGRIHHGSQSLLVTVFNVHGFVHERETEASGYNESHIAFEPGNRILTWKTERDEFIYDVIKDDLSRSELPPSQSPK